MNEAIRREALSKVPEVTLVFWIIKIAATTLEGEALNEPIPMDQHHLHFGKGQTEATIDLAKGQHTLQLVLGDWSHVPHKPPVMSERITITVE